MAHGVATPSSAPSSAAPTPAAGMSLPPPPTVAGAPAAPAATAASYAAEYEPTAALNVVEQTSPTGYQPDAGWEAGATTAWPATSGTTGEHPVIVGAEPFRITPLVGVSALAAVLAVAAAVTDVASYEVSGDTVESAVFTLNDLSTNNLVGVVIAALLLVGGAALGATGRRVGTGLAGGAGLALAGVASMTVGTVTRIFDAQEVTLLSIPDSSFVLVKTQEIGFWLAAIAGMLGLVAFVLALMQSGPDGYAPVNPAVGLVGVLGTLLVVVGPLIPMNDATFGDNFDNPAIPPATLYLRLLVLVFILLGGLVGFLANRRWGFGLALGAISVGAWQWVTALSESGDIPLGIAGGNPGATDFVPHIVTTIGVVVMLLAGAAGLLAAAQQRNTN
ncbi:MAG: hypothetical protein Q7V88_04080 [Actinomycetota bacterium]|nr:hypothetical protein [Actinomycetota bacterium]